VRRGLVYKATYNLGARVISNIHRFDRAVCKLKLDLTLACLDILVGGGRSVPELGFRQLRVYVQSVPACAYKLNASVFGRFLLPPQNKFFD